MPQLWQWKKRDASEKFSKDEMEEMLSHAVDKIKGTILYKEYTGVMAVDEYAL